MLEEEEEQRAQTNGEAPPKSPITHPQKASGVQSPH